MKHIVNFSGGKDSTAMLIRMIEEGMPIDDIVFIKVMATNEIGADYPEMYDYIEKVEDYIGRKITIVPSILTFDEVFHSRYQTGKRAGTMYGFPITIGPWCNDRLKHKLFVNTINAMENISIIWVLLQMNLNVLQSCSPTVALLWQNGE